MNVQGSLFSLTALLVALVLPAQAGANTPNTGTWVALPSMPLAREGLAAAVDNQSRIYALGGFDRARPADDRYLATVERYTPQTNTWETVTPMPYARAWFGAATDTQGRIYVVGGSGPGYGKAERYDPSSNSWQALPSLPIGATHGTMVIADRPGRIYAMGGVQVGAATLKTVYRFNPASNVWDAMAPMPRERQQGVAVLGTDGKIYVFGGVSGIGGNASWPREVDRYDPNADTWDSVAPIPIGPSNFYGGGAGPDGTIYWLAYSDVYAYSPVANTWTKVGSMPSGRNDFTAVTGTDGRIYALGGSDNDSVALHTADAFTPPSANAPPVLTMPASAAAHYGDAVSVQVSASGPEPFDHLSLSAKDLPAGLAFQDRGNGSATLSGRVTAPAGTYPITVSVSDGINPAVSGTITLTVTREQARFAPAGTQPRTVVLSHGRTHVPSLKVLFGLKEPADVDGIGDIATAKPVRYTLTPVSGGSARTGIASVSVSGNDAATGKVTLHNLAPAAYRLHLVIGGRYYHGQADSLIAVYQPTAAGVSGTASLAVGGAPATFNVSADYGKNGTITGALSLTYRATGVTHRLKSTKLSGMVIKGETVWIAGAGARDGAANYRFVATIRTTPSGTHPRVGLWVSDPTYTPMPEAIFALRSTSSGSIAIHRR